MSRFAATSTNSSTQSIIRIIRLYVDKSKKTKCRNLIKIWLQPVLEATRRVIFIYIHMCAPTTDYYLFLGFDSTAIILYVFSTPIIWSGFYSGKEFPWLTFLWESDGVLLLISFDFWYRIANLLISRTHYQFFRVLVHCGMYLTSGSRIDEVWIISVFRRRHFFASTRSVSKLPAFFRFDFFSLCSGLSWPNMNRPHRLKNSNSGTPGEKIDYNAMFECDMDFEY